LKISLIIILISLVYPSYAQPNCEILKADLNCYTSCNTAWKAIRYKQGSYKSQILFDKSIKQCPSFAYSYQQKAVPFLKRGQFIEWKKLIDKAVELSPIEYLGYRGWCRIQFLRDYEGAIKDLEDLKRLVKGDMGYCQNGNYHLEIALGLCYKETGQLKKAKEIFENHMSDKAYNEALYDFYHLGIINFQLNNLEAAKKNFEKQNQINNISESYFYLALIAEKQQNKKEHLSYLKTAELQYRKGISINDNYTEPIDKIYLVDIMNQLKAEPNKRDH